MPAYYFIRAERQKDAVQLILVHPDGKQTKGVQKPKYFRFVNGRSKCIGKNWLIKHPTSSMRYNQYQTYMADLRAMLKHETDILFFEPESVRLLEEYIGREIEDANLPSEPVSK